VFGQTIGIQFETSSYSEIKAKAKKEKKLIFMDCYTTWCGPCTAMSENTFPDAKAGEYFNKYFINAKIDMEKGEGVDIAQQYEIGCYPNLLILDADGNLLHRTAGYKEVDELISFAKTAFDPAKRFSGLKEGYEKNKNNIAFVRNYLMYLGNTCLPSEDVAKQFLSLAKEPDLNNPENWSVIFEHAADINNNAYRHVLKNIDAFISKHTRDSVRQFSLKAVYNEAEKNIIENKTNEEFKAFLNSIRKMNNPTIEEADLFNISLKYYSNKKDWKEYISIAVADGDKYINDGNVNDACWIIYQQSADKSILLKAEGWMKKYIVNHKQDYDWIMGISTTVPDWLLNLNISENDYDRAKAFIANKIIYSHYDTYAALHYKLKNKKDAQSYADMAISVAKKFDLSYESTEELLEKIKVL
jgi:thiol-disulfide isomerase/thioredoxin